MKHRGILWPALASILLMPLLASPAAAIDFGDDASEWAYDGECDDPRFTGPGMTTTALLADDILRDATDCRSAFEAGRIRLE